MVLSHYLNQYWNTVNWNLRNKSQWTINQNSYIFIQGNAFENVICKIASIMSQPLCATSPRGHELNIILDRQWNQVGQGSQECWSWQPVQFVHHDSHIANSLSVIFTIFRIIQRLIEYQVYIWYLSNMNVRADSRFAPSQWDGVTL